MREILFRGIDEGTNEWVYGYYYEKPSDFGGEKRYYIFDEKTISKYNVLPKTVGQYTGLTDKNGKKIFEGDYWLDTDGDYLVYVVEFREGQFGFVCYGWKGVLMPYGFDETAGGFGEIDFSPMTDFSTDLIEIDGNIHDNPELLKGE